MATAPHRETTAAEYHFAGFRLVPRTHELWRGDELASTPRLMFDCLAYLVEHRDRVVGLDELVSAVWGRVDVADAQVRQLIARVRTLVDDNATDQRAIRTLPGVGYRWVMPIETCGPALSFGSVGTGQTPAFSALEPRPAGSNAPPLAELQPRGTEVSLVQAASSPSGDTAATEAEVPSNKKLSPGGIAAVLAVFVLCGAAAFVLSEHFAGRKETAPLSVSTGPAQAIVVLPLQVGGPEDVAWVRLGAMDLIANRLRGAGLPVPPSETVVVAVHAIGEPLDAGHLGKLRQSLGAASLVQGNAIKSDSGWKVDLLTTTADGLRHTSEATRPDVTEAARQAADLLLASLGHPTSADKGESTSDLQEVLLRAQAALLANQLDTARSILLGAPPALQSDPHIRFKLAQLDQRAGKQDESAITLKALLDDPSVTSRPALHAQILNLLATIAFRHQDCEGSERNAAEAIGLLRDQGLPAELGQALTTRALANVCMDRFDIAVDDLGKARTQAEAAGDRLGVAMVDHTMGKAEFQRNRPGESIAYFESADEAFSSIGAIEPLIANLTNTYYAQSSLLRRTDALATSERLWALHERAEDPGRRMYLGVIRSDGLTATGHYSEAEAVLAQLKDAEKELPPNEARLVFAARADLHWHRGLFEQALAEADQALASFLDQAGPEDGERASLLLQRQRISIAAGYPARAEPPLWTAGKLSLPALLIARAEWFGHAGQFEEADRIFREALAATQADGVPEQIALAAQAYGNWLLARNRLDEAAGQAGRVALWAGQDYDSALLQVAVFHALRRANAWAKALKQAQSLAGERRIPDALQIAPAN